MQAELSSFSISSQESLIHNLEHPISRPPYHKKTLTMSKTLVIFGSTGQQGSSVLQRVLNDPELSQQYKIRAITRDVKSSKAKALKAHGNIEVVQGDASDRSSVEAALTGAHTIFLMTTPSFEPNAVEVEYNTGKIVADVAVEKGSEVYHLQHSPIYIQDLRWEVRQSHALRC